MRADVAWTKAKIIDRCERLRSSIEARSLASEEELERVWPDRGERAKKGEWIYCYGQLSGFRRRSEWLEAGTDHAEEELLKAIRDEPQPVMLSTGEEVSVHPKSHDALRWFQLHGWVVGWLDARAAALREAIEEEGVDREHVPEPVTTLAAASREIALQTACFCWAACHPGPKLPWDIPPAGYWAMTDQEPPDRFLDLAPVDVIRINLAFMRANVRGLAYLKKTNGDRSDGRSGWDVFFARRAKQLGQPGRYVMMEVSLVSQLAEGVLASPDLEDLE